MCQSSECDSRHGRGPQFILWNSTNCGRQENLVLPPSKEKARLVELGEASTGTIWA